MGANERGPSKKELNGSAKTSQNHISFFFFHIMRVAIVLPIYVLFRFKGNLKLKWVYNACFAPCSYVSNKKTNEIWFCEVLARPLSSFLEGPRSFALIVF